MRKTPETRLFCVRTTAQGMFLFYKLCFATHEAYEFRMRRKILLGYTAENLCPLAVHVLSNVSQFVSYK